MKEQTKMAKQSDYGYCIYQCDSYVIREKIKNDSIQLYIHRKVNAVEIIPRGYLLGTNALDLPK